MTGLASSPTNVIFAVSLPLALVAVTTTEVAVYGSAIWPLITQELLMV
jgi:hypothetical protein